MRAPLFPFIAAAVLGAIACAAPSRVAPAPPLAEVVVPPPPSSTEPDGPPLTRDEALARGRALAVVWAAGPRYRPDRWASFLAEQRLDEPTVRRMLDAVARACLAEPDAQAAACRSLRDDEGPRQATTALVAILGEVADPATRFSPSMRLLLRLDARGTAEAGSAVVRLLERRIVASTTPCAPPSPAEVETARSALTDLAILVPTTPRPAGHPSAQPASPASAAVQALQAPQARWPTPAELDDLAYFYAMVAGAGPEVGKAEEDRRARKLPAEHPDVALRAGLANEMRAALLDGDVVRHLRAAEAYLTSLGYPGPLRLAEDADQRWGGAGASFAMRDAARSAEIAGRYDLAEALYRRAQPGGGMCGTTTYLRHAAQIEGAIRAGEQGRGCRAVAAERLYATAEGREAPYGPERLARAGLDVPRLYAGALLTLGRDDGAGLERALQGLPARGAEALTRLARLGTEAWATRVRAVPGYADTAHGAGLPRLLDLAEADRAEARVAALDALGRLAEDNGFDPCLPTTFGSGWHRSSTGGARVVRSVMGACATRIDAATVGAAARRVEALATDPDPTVREAAAVALGRLASPRSRRVLEQLAKDTFDAGGQTCTQKGDAPMVCGPNLPVAHAAREALERIAEADEMRAQQRATRRK